jgi:protein phosphatase
MAGRTDRGRLRERNEDCLAVDEALGVAVVADGMGGLASGDVASREAVASVLAHLRGATGPIDAARLEGALAAANDRVRTEADASEVVMGTTAVVLALHEGRCRIAHVGDSRGYHFHQGELSLVTRDHSIVQEMVDRGLLTPELARRSPSRNVITRALGLEDAVAADSAEFPVAPGDLLLLCSDGLWDMLEDNCLTVLLAECAAGRQDVDGCVQALVDAANDAGGLDNITVVVARC